MLAPSSDRILVELFQILKDDAVESAALNMQYAICTQYAICWLPAKYYYFFKLTFNVNNPSVKNMPSTYFETP